MSHEAFLAIAQRNLVAAQRDFKRIPSAGRWNSVTAAMFVFQQIKLCPADVDKKGWAVIESACANVPNIGLADAIAQAKYGSPWVELQREFFQ